MFRYPYIINRARSDESSSEKIQVSPRILDYLSFHQIYIRCIKRINYINTPLTNFAHVWLKYTHLPTANAMDITSYYFDIVLENKETIILLYNASAKVNIFKILFSKSNEWGLWGSYCKFLGSDGFVSMFL